MIDSCEQEAICPLGAEKICWQNSSVINPTPLSPACTLGSFYSNSITFCFLSSYQTCMLWCMSNWALSNASERAYIS